MSKDTLLLVAKFEDERIKCWKNVFGEDEYHYRLSYSHRLLLRLYIAHIERKPVYKMDAARLVPVQHSASARKHLDELEDRKLICFAPDEIDHRKIKVVFTTQGLRDIKKYLTDIRDLTITYGIALQKL